MTPHVERDAPLASPEAVPPDSTALAALGAQPLGSAAPLDADLEAGYRLPADHPPWIRDAVALSARARAVLTRLKPVVIRVLAAWEHRVRSILVAGRRLSIDATGCYRVD